MPEYDLPLFPLEQLLVPSMPLQLRIFEPRYREMIGACLQGDRRFGVVLIREGLEVGETASPYDVGTIAEITAAQEFDDGQLLIVTEGRERFRILERFYDRSYLHGTVELLDEPIGLLENTSLLAEEVRALTMRYVGIVLAQEMPEDAEPSSEDQPSRLDEFELALPEEPLDLSYKVLSLLQQIPDLQRQQLLEATSAEDRLRQEALIVRREVLILEHIAAMPIDKNTYFSPN